MDSKRYVPAAVGFERINKEPLDKYEVFDSINELKDYVNFGPAYYGQVCVVRFSDGVSLSYSIGKNKTINPILSINISFVCAKYLSLRDNGLIGILPILY